MKVLMVVLAGLFIAWNAAFAGEEVGAPIYRDEDTWLYSIVEKDFIGSSSNALNGLYEITIVDGDAKVFYVSDGVKEEITVAGPVKAVLGKGEYLGGGENGLQFPLFVGKKWQFTYSVAQRGERHKSLRSAEVKVTGVEYVHAKAGTFRTFKLVRTDSAGANSGWVFTYYYSPETKSVIKYQFDFSVGTGAGGKRDIELISYNISK